MTELAYLVDPAAAYVRSFTARVTALPPGGVVLDRTFFYPAGGGQLADRGTLRLADGPVLEVVDVTKSGPAVLHRVARSAQGPALALGVEVQGEIDWARRHDHMRLHTAQHLLSARIFSLTGLRTRKAAMARNGGTIDLEAALPPGRSVAQLEIDVNDFFARDLSVGVAHVPRGEWERAPAARSGLVELPPHVDPVRVIEIAGVDRCPCGGTHVRSTGEVGRLTLSPPVPIPGGAVRVPFTLDAAAPPTPPA